MKVYLQLSIHCTNLLSALRDLELSSDNCQSRSRAETYIQGSIASHSCCFVKTIGAFCSENAQARATSSFFLFPAALYPRFVPNSFKTLTLGRSKYSISLSHAAVFTVYNACWVVVTLDPDRHALRAVRCSFSLYELDVERVKQRFKVVKFNSLINKE